MSMGGVKILIVFAMAALCLAVVPRRVRLDELVALPHCSRLASNSVGVGLLVLPRRFVN